jgi:hypothetical protein
VVGNHAYVVGSREISEDEFATFHVVDVTEPANPVLLATRNIGEEEPVSVDVLGNYAYIAGYGPALRIFDISNPANPMPLAAYGTNRYAMDVSIAGKYGCIVGRTVELVDISDPANPIGVATFPLAVGDDEDVGVHVLDNRIYVAAGYSGLHMLEMTLAPISIARAGGQLVLNWDADPGMRLQQAPSLMNPIWSDIPGSDGQSTVQLPIGSGNMFFRLLSP